MSKRGFRKMKVKINIIKKDNFFLDFGIYYSDKYLLISLFIIQIIFNFNLNKNSDIIDELFVGLEK